MECRWSSQCPGAGARCVDNQCQPGLPCTTSKQCSAAAGICDKIAGYCVDCADEVDCKPGQKCQLGQCVAAPPPCATSKDCAAWNLVCVPDLGCVDCDSDADCGQSEFCSSHACLTDVCQPGPPSCSDQDTVATCAANGSGLASTPCPDGSHCQSGVCKPVICDPGDASCQGNLAVLCDESGTAKIVAENCGSANKVCVSGTCVDPACTPGETKCDGGQLATCDLAGVAWQTQDCPAGTVCDNGACSPVVCKPGTKACAGNVLQQCASNGTAMLPVADCAASGELCVVDHCTPPLCTPGETQCQAGQLAQCDNGGMSFSTTACPGGTVCSKGACVQVVCKPGSKSCQGNHLHQCDGLGTANPLLTDCATNGQVCSDGACQSPICTPGETQCAGASQLVCPAPGLAWVAQACPPGTACGSSKACEPMVCQPSATICAGETVLHCDALGLKQSTLQDCAATGKVCADGVCQSPICKPGASECQGDVLATCVGKGLQWSKVSCPYGQTCDVNACMLVICQPAALSCAGDKLNACNAKGTGYNPVANCAADGHVCEAGACQTPICVPGATKCVAAQLATCNAKGLAFAIGNCPSGQACNLGACKPILCTPNAPTCVGEQVQVCNATGTALDPGQDCAAAGKVCVGAQCLPVVCKSGEVKCIDSFTFSTCNAKGTGTTLSACPTGQACSGGACVPMVCTPGAVSCAGAGVAKCASDGLSSVQVQNCAVNGQVCNQGACKTPICTPGATECQSGSLATCAATGLAWLQASCPANNTCVAGACLPLICTPNAAVCDGALLRKCNSTGTAQPVVTDCGAAGQLCNAGACAPQVCVPNSVSCDANGNQKICDAKGLSFSVVACATGSICSGSSCVAKVCQPAAVGCNGNLRQQCDSQGLKWLTVQDCAQSSQVCDGGACKSQACVPNTATCQGDQLALCANNGLSWYVTDCPAGKVCDQGQCTPVVCAANGSACSNFKVMKCNAKGTAQTEVADCALAKQACVSGACVAATCWPPGSKVCAGPQLGTCKGDATGYAVTTCDDNDACTNNTCDAATTQCVFPVMTTCTDNDLCTSDACDKTTGKCVFTPVTGSCDDGDACTVGETCATGKCAPPATFSIAAYAGSKTGFADGPASTALFSFVGAVVRDVNGNLYISDQAPDRIRKVDPSGNVSTLAGNGLQGLVDGPGNLAKFNMVQGLAVDATGTVYVADRYNHRIRRVTSDGYVTSLAGTSAGFLDGPASSAQFNNPSSLALDAATGFLYVTDAANNRIRLIKPTGVVSTLCGAGTAGYNDGACSSALFSNPNAVAVLADGSVAVGDSTNRRIRLVKNGAVTTIAGSGAAGYVDGAASSATFPAMFSLVPGPVGELYICDGGRVRLLANNTVATIAGGGSSKSDGPATSFALAAPVTLALGPNRSLFLGDGPVLRKLVPSGGLQCDDLNPCTADACNATSGSCTFSPALAGAVCNDGNACTATSSCDGKGACGGPAKNCDDANTCTFDVCDALSGACDNHPIDAACTDGTACTQVDTCLAGKCVVDQLSLTTVAGSISGAADGAGSAAKLGTSWGMAVQADGSVVFTDFDYNTIRQMTPAGSVTTVAGIANQAGYQDGAAASAKFNHPAGLAIDGQGRYVVADSLGNRIRLVDPKSWQVTTIAGSGTSGYVDGAASSAGFSSPRAVAIDSAGAIYVFDASNVRVRKIAAGVVSTVAGTGKVGKQDGAASSATFGVAIWQMAFGADGSLYLADSANHSIRKLAGDQVTTVVGASAGFADGPLAVARLSGPTGLAANPAGELFVGDTGNYRLRHLFLGDSMFTESGNGGVSSVDGLGSAGSYTSPTVVATAANGIVYVADQFKIRRSTAAAVDCNDGKPCTADACDPATGGCSHVPIGDGGSCSDGDACTTGETCKSGACGGGVSTNCDDGNPCTLDSCDSKAGCTNGATGQWQSCGGNNYCQFGKCAPSPCVGKDPSACTGFVGSTLMTVANQAQLELMEGGVPTWKLCYKASVHGFDSQVFHAKCDGLKPTVTVMHSTAGAIFGGYATSAWSGSAGYLPNPGGWLFRLDSGLKFPLAPQGPCIGNGIYSSLSYGPTFGAGHDLTIGSGMKTGYANFPYTYACPANPTPCQSTSGACASTLAGSYNSWQLDDVEVFYPAP